jgi:hypothetical protein
VLERKDDDIRLNVVAVQKAFSVTAAVATDDHVHIARLDPKRVYITCNALHVQEIADYWRPGQHAFPEDRRPGTSGGRSSTNVSKSATGGLC